MSIKVGQEIVTESELYILCLCVKFSDLKWMLIYLHVILFPRSVQSTRIFFYYGSTCLSQSLKGVNSTLMCKRSYRRWKFLERKRVKTILLGPFKCSYILLLFYPSIDMFSSGQIILFVFSVPHSYDLEVMRELSRYSTEKVQLNSFIPLTQVEWHRLRRILNSFRQ